MAINAYTREYMVAELKKLGYDRVKVKGGYAPLETAPSGNLYYAYLNITGRRNKIAKINPVKG